MSKMTLPLSVIAMFSGIAGVGAETCNLISSSSMQDCLAVVHSEKQIAPGLTEYHWKLRNSCTVQIEVRFTQGKNFGCSVTVPAKGEKFANCSGFAITDLAEWGVHDLHVCSTPQGSKDPDRALKEQASPTRPATRQKDDQCSTYKAECTKGCSDKYQITESNFSSCMGFCESPCSNGVLREENPYLKAGSAQKTNP